MCVLACANRSGRSTSPEASPQATVEPLSVALLDKTGGPMMADTEWFERLLESAEVEAAGQRLFDRLGGHPALEPHFDHFVSGLLQQPKLLEAFAAMAARDPDASIDELTARVITRLSEGIDGPVFDAALDASLDRLLDRPAVDDAFGRLVRALLDRARIVERTSALLLQWQPELEAAVGLPMSHDDFVDRLHAHVQQPARERRLRELMIARVEPRLREGLATLIDDDAFLDACARLVERVLTSSGFETNTTAVFAGMIEQVDAARMGTLIDRILVTPEIERAVAAWADELIASDASTTFADRLGAILDDPSLQAELFDVVVGASAGPTA